MRLLIFMPIVMIFNLGYAHNNIQLFGGTYTYIEFVISKSNEYPIVFAAICEKDSIDVNLSDIDTFIESVLSLCDNVTISDYAYHKGFEIIFGNTEKSYNSCSFFISEFNDKFNTINRKGNVFLFSGEKVTFKYFDIMGLFLRLDESLISETLTSVGLNRDYVKKNVIIPIDIMNYYQTKKDFRLNYAPQKTKGYIPKIIHRYSCKVAYSKFGDTS